MTEPAAAPAGLQELEHDYQAAKTRLAAIGFICEGLLIERYASCKNPNCRCADPEQRHGPHRQISWKTGGKTVSKSLTADDAVLYQRWITNRRALEAVLNEMRDISHHAAKQILASRDRPLIAPPRPSRRAA